MDRFFDIPVNLPHAATIAVRVFQRIKELDAHPSSPALAAAQELAEELARYRILGDPEPAEAMVVQSDALDRARQLVNLIRAEQLTGDRLGQAIRNLFECLGAGKEGADAGLLAGEDPNSLQRP